MGLPYSCSCGAIHAFRQSCPLVKRTYRPKDNLTAAERFGPGWAKISRRVVARDKVCQLRLAGCTGIATTADHIVPRSKGGGNEMSNLRGACRHCNSSRGNRG